MQRGVYDDIDPTSKSMKITQRTLALAAGISLIVMAIAAGFSYGYVLGNIGVPGDPAATHDQLIHNDALFKTSLGGWLIIFITDLIVTFSLYLFFRETRKSLSLITAALRLVYTIILGIALVKLFSLLSPIRREARYWQPWIPSGRSGRWD
jgi:hypothetical protein